ncbi:MAG TPA: MFS transporter [Candidatus Dormibacteraeota bacterium]|nr:MFS transporter [Candidatus Dormibacteraeota bacterium]
MDHPPRLRWGIGVLLGVGTLINYIDRVNLSVAGPTLEKVFNIGPAELGILLGAFFGTYSLPQIPVGLILDRFGVTVITRWATFLWSIASGIITASASFGHLIVSRALPAPQLTLARPRSSRTSSASRWWRSSCSTSDGVGASG